MGYYISKVDGESVFECSYETIAGKLKSGERPVLVHFLGYSPEVKMSGIQRWRTS